VEDAEHQNGAAIVPVLKGVCATEHLEEEFAVFLAAWDGSSQLRMSAEDVSPLDKFDRDASRKAGKPFSEERRNRPRSSSASSDHSISTGPATVETRAYPTCGATAPHGHAARASLPRLWPIDDRVP
jgi:hypothetical protein